MKDKLYGRFRLQRSSFSLDAELHVPSKGITGLFGDSGCGKTTVLRCLAGLERADEGYLSVAGKVWQDEANGIFLPPYERPIGIVFQEARLFPHMSVEQNLLFGVKRKRGLKSRPEEFDHILELLGIGHLLERKPERLSGGEMQRVAIGRALLTKPELLLMDEPLAALDNRRKREIMPFLEKLHEELEIPIVYVSHSPEEMIHLADRLVHMEAGRTVGTGEAVEVLARLSAPDRLPPSYYNEFDVVVVGYHDEGQLIEVDSPVGKVLIPASDIELGERLRLRVAPCDVVLSNSPLSGVGMLNSVNSRISDIDCMGGGVVRVTLEVQEHKLISSLNRQCVTGSSFKKGGRVYANFSRVYLDRPTAI